MVTSGPNFIAPANVQTMIGDKGSSNFKAIARDFWFTMQEYLADWVDPNEDLVVNGITVEASKKYGVAGVYLFNQAISDLNTVFEGANQVFTNYLKDPQRLDPSAGT